MEKYVGLIVSLLVFIPGALTAVGSAVALIKKDDQLKMKVAFFGKSAGLGAMNISASSVDYLPCFLAPYSCLLESCFS